MNPKSFYLFARACNDGKGTGSAFFKTAGENVARDLCELFKKEYGDSDGGVEFRYAAVDSLPSREQVLIEESLGWLEVYDDPDPGVYDPQPSREMMTLAQYGVRARAWEEVLRERASKENAAGGEKARAGSGVEPLAGEGADAMSEEDRRNAMLGLLMLLAQAYYHTLEAAVSKANMVSALDLKLNHSYLWATKNLRNLLANSPELKDFPQQFKPALPNLYPTTIQDMEWEWIGPDADGFLSAVQEYTMEKGMYEPEEGSPAWCMIELFRPGVEEAVKRAEAYGERMSAAWRNMIGAPAQNRADAQGKANSGAQPKAPDSETGVAPSNGPNPVPPGSKGRLRWGEGCKDFWIGQDEQYNLRAREKARLCIEYLVKNSAFDAASAKHLVEEIEPYVKLHSGSANREIKIQHYFNSKRGNVRELCKQVIRCVPGKGKYFLKVD